MKKTILILLFVSSVLACKKTVYSPEGPTDVRIRNVSDLNFEDVIVSTSEYPEDKDTIANIPASSESGYTRFKKAYPKTEISAKINIKGSLVGFSTGVVDYTYMQYIGRDKITYEVYSDTTNKKIIISNVILDEPLVIK